MPLAQVVVIALVDRMDAPHPSPQPQMSSELDSLSRKALEDSLKQAKKAAAECILKSSWTFTIPGVLASVPLSIHLKTYSPLVFTAVTASGLDYFNGLKNCKEKTAHVKAIQARIALIDLPGMQRPPSS